MSEEAEGATAAIGWRIGVRDLTRFALRSGDLEHAPAGPDAQAGSRAHRRLQERSGLEAEVALSRTERVRGIAVTVSGRIDLRDLPGRRLIEIKSTLVPLERLLPGRRALDRAQLEMYAWLQEGCDSPEVIPGAGITLLELQYINVRSNRLEYERWRVDAQRVEQQARRALSEWVAFRQILQLRSLRQYRSTGSLAFPHGGFRTGQRQLSVAVYRSVQQGVPLLLEAPTGTGKTLGVLYPAVRALAPDGAKRLVWLTAKRSGRDAVFDALRQLEVSGLRIDALLLRSRRDGCFCERDPSLRDELGRCAFANGFHDRLPGARLAATQGRGSGLLDGAALDALAGEHRVCPHALATELLPWATVVVCDYNHLLDPVSALPALEDRIAESVVLIDEAHNLPDRARQMFCASLSRLEVLQARTLAMSSRPQLSRALHRLSKTLQGAAGAGRADERPDSLRRVCMDAPTAVLRAVRNVLDVLSEGRTEGRTGAEPAIGFPGPAGEESGLPIGLLHGLSRFAAVAERFGEQHRCVVQSRTVGRRRESLVELVCLDARRELALALLPSRATVAFSAVLGPMDDFRDALGLPAAGTAGIRGRSPFAAEQLLCQLVDWIPVRYAERSGALPALVALIADTVAVRQGHYLVFLPSYAWLAQLADAFERAHPEQEVWRQGREAMATGLSERLGRMDRAGTTIGFVITGGVFGEGVDYVGERLIGAIIVGTALPGRDEVTELMIEHHAAQRRRGYDIVCRHPALVRVLQSAGRVIRTVQDRGVLLLVDERFDDSFQRHFRPTHWQVQRPDGPVASRRAIERFWAKGAAAHAASPDPIPAERFSRSSVETVSPS